ncbi:BrnT family toxin [Aquella oligotrophica]|uniref:BrnT family toxin n=1 Tax=Aquella oligotrophica TaxID=2067065 RepID=UPI001C99A064|nr:BrnT family toxin [Aquella oligotrophica]
MQFEWDENKNQANKAKHNLSFETAKHAFMDDNKLVAHNRIVDGEDRYQGNR